MSHDVLCSITYSCLNVLEKIGHLPVQQTKHFVQRLSNVTTCTCIYSYKSSFFSDSDSKCSNLRWTNFVPPHSAQDYYTDSNRKVHKDPLQSYQLLYGRENDTHTVLAFSRNLQTCDDNDKVITVGLTSCIITCGSTKHQWQGFFILFFGLSTVIAFCSVEIIQSFINELNKLTSLKYCQVISYVRSLLHLSVQLPIICRCLGQYSESDLGIPCGGRGSVRTSLPWDKQRQKESAITQPWNQLQHPSRNNFL